MKVSDFIYRFKSFRMLEDGLCRVRLFVNTQNEMICVLTDINIMSNAPYLDTVCDTVIHSLYDDGYLLECKIHILHDDFDNSMAIIDKYGNLEQHLSRKQIETLTECDENEFVKKSMDILSIRRLIEKKRYEINPFINNQYLKTPEYVKREIEIQENAISKKGLKELIDASASERELGALIKKDLSLIAEMYSSTHDEYIVFSEFPIGKRRADFVIFSGRSTMNVTFIEIKGADFNLKKRGHYDNFNAKIEEANSQVRNHRKYSLMIMNHLEKNSIESEKEQNQERTYIMLFWHRRENCKLIQIKMSI